MIKITGISGESAEGSKRLLMVSLFADTKTEVTNSITGADIEGMDDDCDLDAG